MRKSIFLSIIAIVSLAAMVGCARGKSAPAPSDEFVRVRDGKFYIGDSATPYIYI